MEEQCMTEDDIKALRRNDKVTDTLMKNTFTLFGKPNLHKESGGFYTVMAKEEKEKDRCCLVIPMDKLSRYTFEKKRGK
jgi:hypothetical protein